MGPSFLPAFRLEALGSSRGALLPPCCASRPLGAGVGAPSGPPLRMLIRMLLISASEGGVARANSGLAAAASEAQREGEASGALGDGSACGPEGAGADVGVGPPLRFRRGRREPPADFGAPAGAAVASRSVRSSSVIARSELQSAALSARRRRWALAAAPPPPPPLKNPTGSRDRGEEGRRSASCRPPPSSRRRGSSGGRPASQRGMTRRRCIACIGTREPPATRAGRTRSRIPLGPEPAPPTASEVFVEKSTNKNQTAHEIISIPLTTPMNFIATPPRVRTVRHTWENITSKLCESSHTPGTSSCLKKTVQAQDHRALEGLEVRTVDPDPMWS